jgi:hypothetical protein
VVIEAAAVSGSSTGYRDLTEIDGVRLLTASLVDRFAGFKVLAP